MKPFATIKPIAVTLGALFLAFAVGASPATAQDGTSLSIDTVEVDGSGQAVDVPVQATNFDNVGSISLVINYDPSVVSFPSGELDPSDLISGAPRSGFNATRPSPGEVRISWFDQTGSNPINLGDGTLLNLTFSTFAGGTSTVGFDEANSEVSDSDAQVIDVAFNDGLVTNAIGSVSVDSVDDAVLNETVAVPLSGEGQEVGAVSLEINFDPSVVQFEGIANDQSGLGLTANASNGVVTIAGQNTSGGTLSDNFVEVEFSPFLGGSTSLEFLDASEVTDTEGNVVSTDFVNGTLSGDTPTVSFPDRGATAGETVSVPVLAEDLQEVGAVSIDATFNPSVLTFEGTEEGFDALTASNPSAGVVRIAGQSTGGLNPAENGGKFINLLFSVDGDLDLGTQETLGFNVDESSLSNTQGTSYNTGYESGTLVIEQTLIGLSAQSLTYDVTAIDSTSEQTVTITNESGEVATLSGEAALTGADTPFAIASGGGSFSLEPGESQDVTVDYAPVEVSNPDRDTLSITHDADNQGSPIEVPLQGTAEAPQIAASIAPSDTTVESGESATFTQTVTNEANQVADLEAQVTSVPEFLTLENSSITGGGTFDAETLELTLEPGAEATLTYNFEESVDSTTTFEGAISHETNDPENATVDLPVAVTAETVEIAVAPESVTYDVTALDSTSSQSVTVTNEAEDVATLEGQVALSNSGTPFTVASGGGSLTLGPGESQDVAIDYSPQEVSNPDENSLVVSDASGTLVAEVPLQGTAEAPQIAASIAPSDTTVESGESATFTQTVTNEANQVADLEAQVTSVPEFLTLENSSITGGGTFDAETLELTLEPGAEATLTYNFEESVDSTTTFEGAISHETNDPENATVDLPVTVTVSAAQIAVNPTSLDYGVVSVGEDSTQTVEVSNTNGATLTVDSVETDAPFAVESGSDGFDVPGGESETVGVTYAPDDPTSIGNPDTGTLLLYHQGDNMDSPVEVSLEGAAEDSEIAVAPQSVSYDVTALDSTSSQSVTITNEASETATFEGEVTLSSSETPFAITSGGGSLTLGPGESQDVAIDYSPQEMSNPDENSLVVSNASGNLVAEVPLEGTAEAPQIAASIAPSDTTIQSGDVLTLTQTITNEADQVADLEAQVTSVPEFLTLENSSITGGGTFDAETLELTLEPGAEATLTYNFEESVDSTTTFEGAISHETNDPNNETVDLGVSSTVEPPQIAASIVPSDTTVNSGEALTLTQTVTNEADQVADLEAQVTSVPEFLTLENSSITGGGTFDAETLELTLEPGAEATLTYNFEESVDSTTDFEGAISHETNDPNAPTVDLPVAVTVSAAQIAVNPSELDYGVLAVGSDSTRDLTVENPNGATLTVDSVETDAPFAVESGSDGFDVPGGESQAVGVMYAPEEATAQGAPDEGVVQVYHQGDNMPSPLTVSLQGAAEAPQFAVSPTEVNTTVTSGEATEFSATIDNQADQVADLTVEITSVPDFLTLEGAEGATFDPADSTLTVAPEGSATVTYSFSESVNSTTEFSGAISHETNDPETSAVDIPVTITVEPAAFAVDVSRSFANASDPSNYELVALPGQVDVDVAQTLSGEQGTEWRAFREVGASGSGDAGLDEYDGSEAFNFRPGRAFWVISQNNWSFEQETVGAVQEGDGAPSVALQGGWNAVSNPLQADLSWSAVQSANGLSEALWRWSDNGSWEQADTLRSATEGEAYYVFNSADLDSLDLTTTGSSGQAALATTESPQDATPRTVRLTASAEESDRTSSVTVGVNDGGKRPTTYRAPPSHFGSTALRIVGDQSDTQYMRMVAPLGDQESKPFDLKLQATTGSSVTLEASDLPETVSSDFGVVLVETQTGTSYDLRRGSATIPVNSESGMVSLRVHLGSKEAVQKQSAPEQTKLLPNYPNPFTQQTTIEYTLSEQTDVTVRVYNVLGQQVATLAQEPKSAGTHRLEWNGGTLPSGTYFVRLKAGGNTHTQQITIVR